MNMIHVYDQDDELLETDLLDRDAVEAWCEENGYEIVSDDPNADGYWVFVVKEV